MRVGGTLIFGFHVDREFAERACPQPLVSRAEVLLFHAGRRRVLFVSHVDYEFAEAFAGFSRIEANIEVGLDNTSIDFFTGAVPREFVTVDVRLRLGALLNGRVVALLVLRRVRSLGHGCDVTFAVRLDATFEFNATDCLGRFDAEDV